MTQTIKWLLAGIVGILLVTVSGLVFINRDRLLQTNGATSESSSQISTSESDSTSSASSSSSVSSQASSSETSEMSDILNNPIAFVRKVVVDGVAYYDLRYASTLNGKSSKIQTYTTVPDYKLSPSGKYLAYLSRTSKTLVVFDTQTKKKQELEQDIYLDTVVSWSPDDKYIAVSGGLSSKVVDRETGQAVLNYGDNVDGDSIVWLSAKKMVYLAVDTAKKMGGSVFSPRFIRIHDFSKNTEPIIVRNTEKRSYGSAVISPHSAPQYLSAQGNLISYLVADFVSTTGGKDFNTYKFSFKQLDLATNKTVSLTKQQAYGEVESQVKEVLTPLKQLEYLDIYQHAHDPELHLVTVTQYKPGGLNTELVGVTEAFIFRSGSKPEILLRLDLGGTLASVNWIEQNHTRILDKQYT